MKLVQEEEDNSNRLQEDTTSKCSSYKSLAKSLEYSGSKRNAVPGEISFLVYLRVFMPAVVIARPLTHMAANFCSRSKRSSVVLFWMPDYYISFMPEKQN